MRLKIIGLVKSMSEKVARRVLMRYCPTPIDIVANDETEYREFLEHLLKTTGAAVGGSEVERFDELPKDNLEEIKAGYYWVEIGDYNDDFRPEDIPVSPFTYGDLGLAD